MSLRQAAQQALEALALLQGDIEWTSNSPTLKFVNSTVAALRAALAEPEQEPQTTHWEGCEAVHPECKEKNT